MVLVAAAHASAPWANAGRPISRMKKKTASDDTNNKKVRNMETLSERAEIGCAQSTAWRGAKMRGLSHCSHSCASVIQPPKCSVAARGRHGIVERAGVSL